jgi:hypothetical protein
MLNNQVDALDCKPTQKTNSTLFFIYSTFGDHTVLAHQRLQTRNNRSFSGGSQRTPGETKIAGRDAIAQLHFYVCALSAVR